MSDVLNNSWPTSSFQKLVCWDMRCVAWFIVLAAVSAVRVFDPQQVLQPDEVTVPAVQAIEFSVVIPCIPRDKGKLKTCLVSIKNQLYKPKEVIISISETTNEERIALERELEPIQMDGLKIISTTEQQYAGPNRNRGAKEATGTHISFFDADDEMHPSRLAVLRQAVELYHPKCVLHSDVMSETALLADMGMTLEGSEYYLGRTIFEKTREADVKQYGAEAQNSVVVTPEVVLQIPSTNNAHVQYGHITCGRTVLEDEQYHEIDRGQDVRFARQVLKRYGDTDSTMMYINLPLSIYHPSNHPNNVDLNKGIENGEAALQNPPDKSDAEQLINN